MLQHLTAEIASNGAAVAREDVLHDVCRSIAAAVKAKEFALYLVHGDELVKHEHGGDKG